MASSIRKLFSLIEEEAKAIRDSQSVRMSLEDIFAESLRHTLRETAAQEPLSSEFHELAVLNFMTEAATHGYGAQEIGDFVRELAPSAAADELD